LSGGRDPPFHETPQEYIELYSTCWSEKSEDRPSCEKVCESLNLLYEQSLSDNRINSRGVKRKESIFTGIFGAKKVELISPVILCFPGVPELFGIIERIVGLIDSARYYRGEWWKNYDGGSQRHSRNAD
jgi:hypothetical protein